MVAKCFLNTHHFSPALILSTYSSLLIPYRDNLPDFPFLALLMFSAISGVNTLPDGLPLRVADILRRASSDAFLPFLWALCIARVASDTVRPFRALPMLARCSGVLKKCPLGIKIAWRDSPPTGTIIPRYAICILNL